MADIEARTTAHRETKVSPGLARGSIGLHQVLFQAVTSMAPAGAVAFAIPVGAAYAGGALSLSVVVALLGCLSVAVSIGQMSQHLPSAGSIYTFPARGLHPSIGFLAGWGYALVESLGAPVAYLIFASQLASLFTTGSGTSFNVVWVLLMFVAAFAVMVLGYIGVKISTETGTALGAFEILVFGILAVWLIVRTGSHNTLSPFSPGSASVVHFVGWSGIFAGAVYTMLAFIGFEAAAPLAEETKDPLTTIKRAVVYSCFAIGAFYVFTTYAATVFFGPSKFAVFGQFGGGSPWVQIAKQVWGGAWIIALIAILNSNIAGGNANSNAVTRTWYAMARIRLLPQALTRIHPTRRSPYVAVVVQFLVTLIIGIPLGLKYGPITAFIIMATLISGVMIAIYMVINLSCTLYYLRERRSEFNLFLHGLIPLGGLIFLVPVLFASFGIGKSIFSFVSPLPDPLSLAGPAAAIWYTAGVVYLIYLYRRHPERIEETRQIFIDDSAEQVDVGRRRED